MRQCYVCIAIECKHAVKTKTKQTKKNPDIWGNKKRDACDMFLPKFSRAGIQRKK